MSRGKISKVFKALRPRPLPPGVYDAGLDDYDDSTEAFHNAHLRIDGRSICQPTQVRDSVYLSLQLTHLLDMTHVRGHQSQSQHYTHTTWAGIPGIRIAAPSPFHGNASWFAVPP